MLITTLIVWWWSWGYEGELDTSAQFLLGLICYSAFLISWWRGLLSDLLRCRRCCLRYLSLRLSRGLKVARNQSRLLLRSLLSTCLLLLLLWYNLIILMLVRPEILSAGLHGRRSVCGWCLEEGWLLVILCVLLAMLLVLVEELLLLLLGLLCELLWLLQLLVRVIHHWLHLLIGYWVCLSQAIRGHHDSNATTRLLQTTGWCNNILVRLSNWGGIRVKNSFSLHNFLRRCTLMLWRLSSSLYFTCITNLRLFSRCFSSLILFCNAAEDFRDWSLAAGDRF